MVEVRMNVKDNSSFNAEEVSVIHNPLRIVLDFKSVTPRVDVSGQPMRMTMEHNVVVLEPYLAKNLLRVLEDNIKNYEKRFGKIDEPKAMEKAKKLAKADGKKAKEVKQDYFG